MVALYFGSIRQPSRNLRTFAIIHASSSNLRNLPVVIASWRGKTARPSEVGQ